MAGRTPLTADTESARLREENERLRSLFRNSLIGMYRTTPDGRILAANPALVRMLGYRSFGQLARRNLEKDGYHPEYPRSQFKQRIERDGRIVGLESEWLRRDGTTLFVRESARAIRDPRGRVVCYDGTVEDVTDRKRAEVSLRAALTRLEALKSIVERGPAVVFRWRIAEGWPVEFVSENIAHFGYTVEDMTSGRVSWPGITHPDDVPRLEAEVRGYLARGADEFSQEYRLFTKSGDVRWVEDRNRVIRDATGEPRYIEGIAWDTTDRKRAEEALRDSEQRYRTLFENAPLGIGLTTPDGRVLAVNDAIAQIVGCPADELRRGTVAFAYAQRTERRRMLAQLRREGRVRGFESRLRRKDGSIVPVSMTVTWLGTPGSGVLLTLLEDITDRKRAEAELRRTGDQLRALAARIQAAREEERTLIAREIHDGLAHDLTALQFDLAWLGRKLGSPQRAAGVRDRIRAMTAQLDQTIQNVTRTASALRPDMLDELGLPAAIEWEIGGFRERTGIRCTLKLPRRAPRLDRERATALFRILQELLTNAARHAQASEVRVRLTAGKRAVRLEVRDDGRGITTRELASTASLGILGMRERAALAGGECLISGRRGRGTTAIVSVPLGVTAHRKG